MTDLTIGALAKSAGVGVETIRFYERQGLIEQPQRPVGGFRHYPQDVVMRVRFIRRAKELGFSLKEIGELLDLALDPMQSCSEVKRRAEAKVSDIDRKIEALAKIKEELSRLVVACGTQNQPQGCPIIESIVGEDPDTG
ncbi:MerR family transcriptional regulator [Desulfoluna butyratoxydans]|uniref:Mercuric resistance operon regulatory protein n=1 Tax=Desulfoluna butyratoxydans TaxID=231438 RepID=A0A4U8YJC9_9BACT|nr:MerR family DNA-binding protein [Desulfoluna butyratoxydans]VFQ43487.1 transcription regulator merr dna binding [Desulfoluna butyratoxydans]